MQQQFFQTRPIPIGGDGSPVGISYCSDGSVAFAPASNLTVVIDNNKDYCAMYSKQAMIIDGEEFDYGVRYQYKQIPKLLAWLKAQNMVMPV